MVYSPGTEGMRYVWGGGDKWSQCGTLLVCSHGPVGCAWLATVLCVFAAPAVD